jgi:hypothetical protein
VKEYVDVLGFNVVICYDKMGNWKRDKIIFRQDTNQTIEEREALSVIQYLYDEGFIVDRRIQYQILNK